MPHSNKAQEPQALKPACPRDHAPQQEKPLQGQPHVPQLGVAPTGCD